MKPRTYHVELNRTAYAAGLAALVPELARQDTARPRMLFARLATIVAILAIVMFAFPSAVLALFTAIFLFWVGESLVQTAFRTQTLGVSFDPAAHASTRVEFSDDAIVEQGASRVRRWAWDAVRRVHLARGHVVIELAGWEMIVLPDRLWRTPEERSAFLAELAAWQPAIGIPSTALAAAEAEARVKLVEPVLIARIALAVAMFQLVFEAQLPLAKSPGSNAVFVALAAGSLAAAMMWWASGHAFRRLASRSPATAIRTAWGVFALLAALFALWFLRSI